MSTFNFPHIRKRSCRPYPESGADTQKPVKMVARLSSTKYGSKDVEFSSGLPTLNDGLSDRTNFCYSDSVNGIVTGNPWNFD